MQKLSNYKALTLLILLLTITVSCTKNKDTKPNIDPIPNSGVFISCEGNFSAANSSLSYYYPSSAIVENNIFYKANNVPLGDVAQSLTNNDSVLFIVVNNSGIIYGVNRNTLVFDGKISGLVSPREMLLINDNKAYVSDLFEPKLTVVDPNNYSIVKKIMIGKSSDCMVIANNKVFAANWSSYNQLTINNTVMVINPDDDTLIDSLVVGIEPNSMVVDKNNNLWVLCSGGYLNDENPTLWQWNTTNLELLNKFTFADKQSSPDNLCINSTGDSLYFISGSVFSMSILDGELPNNELINKANHNYYSMAISPYDNQIYVSDALDYNQNGVVYRYSAVGVLLSSFEVGIIPGSFKFVK